MFRMYIYITNQYLVMVSEGIGRVFPVGGGNTRYVSIPSLVATDERFPFEDDENVRVRIEGPRVVIEKVD